VWGLCVTSIGGILDKYRTIGGKSVEWHGNQADQKKAVAHGKT
jgi:hypothetical protein